MGGKTRVGIVFGGKSAEHEVSLQSARNIVEALDKNRYDVTLIGIDKQGQWHVNNASNYLLHAENPALIALNRSNVEVALVPGKREHQLVATQGAPASVLGQIDVIFPIVHGTQGEDGSLQGMLRMANLPFVGSDVLGSAVCMDKDVTKRLLRDAGLAVAPFVAYTRGSAARASFDEVAAKLGLPLFVKPANMGSSVGVSKVRNEAEFRRAITLALEFDHKVLVEQAIAGREIECAVLGNDDPQASVCGEVVLHDEFYSYDTKYINESGAAVVVPADIDARSSDEVRRIAIQAFLALDCAGMARVDVFLTPQGKVIVNEVNTLPGFTHISMYPKLWQASGMTYTELITRLIELAQERHAQDSALKTSIL
ncbi:D-alanine--D-alanine ligase [Candidimonas nitroreducens]|uniref:D-alanine--D-alanine ligase n=1 Tax=Candidimonas nitroreducens TaxID=683354 RepID=A0A225MKJ0_9BURK|nr:D-alanine--D-alanine ligase [Candidimonas nitroreducens]OWT61705.1 D-alanine--D-alanine ligase A [Candidimonas nitroreducens]